MPSAPARKLQRAASLAATEPIYPCRVQVSKRKSGIRRLGYESDFAVARAERLGLEVIKVYADKASGARSDRTALAAVLAGAHRREFDVLLIWSLDRLSREGIGPMTRYGIWISCERPAYESRTTRRPGSTPRRPAAAGGPGVAPDRPGHEGAHDDPPALLEGVPKVPCGPDVATAAFGGGFRGGRGRGRRLKVSGREGRERKPLSAGVGASRARSERVAAPIIPSLIQKPLTHRSPADQ